MEDKEIVGKVNATHPTKEVLQIGLLYEDNTVKFADGYSCHVEDLEDYQLVETKN